MRATSPGSIAFVIALGLLGCVSRWETSAGPGTLHWGRTVDPTPRIAPIPAVDPEVAARVQLMPGMPTRVCEVVGLLHVEARPEEGERALAELRARAAALGADAVVHVRLHGEDSIGAHSISGDPEWEAFLDGGEASREGVLSLTGEAVRFRDSIRGRDYRVVGRIGVSDRRGREAEAFRRLAARARALRADLVIEVEVTRAGATRPFQLRGTAIRFLQ